MKKLFISLGIAATFVAVGGLAFAGVVVDGVNDRSTVSSDATYLIKLLLKNNNNANIENHVGSSGNSGGNTFSSVDDSEGLSLETGGASSVTLVDNTANSTMLETAYDAGGPNNNISHVNDGSAVTTTVVDTLDKDAVNNNDVAVLNDVGAVSDSGSNAWVAGDSLKNVTAVTGTSDAATGVSNAFNFIVQKVIRLLKFKP